MQYTTLHYTTLHYTTLHYNNKKKNVMSHIQENIENTKYEMQNFEYAIALYYGIVS